MIIPSNTKPISQPILQAEVGAQGAMIEDVAIASAALARTHYENFPVASIALPRKYRHPIAMIYSFARQADDFADEGQRTPAERLALLAQFKAQLDLIAQQAPITSPFFIGLQAVIRQHHLPLQPFYDLLDAFSQDVTQQRYANFAQVLDYCRRSANPVGTLLLHLYGKATPDNLMQSEQICSALQLINFYQDVVIDFEQAAERSRVYLCQDEMAAYGVTEAQIASKTFNPQWHALMMMNIERAHAMLIAGKPLGRALPGRIGFELRMIISGGEHIVHQLKRQRGNVFAKRPRLHAWDWPMIVFNALVR